MTIVYKGVEFKGKYNPKTHKLEVLTRSKGWGGTCEGDEQLCKEFAQMAMDNGALDFRIVPIEGKQDTA